MHAKLGFHSWEMLCQVISCCSSCSLLWAQLFQDLSFVPREKSIWAFEGKTSPCHVRCCFWYEVPQKKKLVLFSEVHLKMNFPEAPHQIGHTRTERADLFIVCCRSVTDVPADLQTMCRSSAECLQSVCSNDLQQVCKFADALQTKSAYHVKQRAHKMHQSNKVYLKDRQRRSVCYSSKVNIMRTKMLGETRAIKSLADERY